MLRAVYSAIKDRTGKVSKQMVARRARQKTAHTNPGRNKGACCCKLLQAGSRDGCRACSLTLPLLLCVCLAAARGGMQGLCRCLGNSPLRLQRCRGVYRYVGTPKRFRASACGKLAAAG